MPFREKAYFQTSAGPIVHPVQNLYAQKIHDAVRSDVLRPRGPETVRYESVFHKNTSFVGMVQIYSNRTAQTLKANAIVTCQVHIVFFNFSKRYYRFLTNYRHALFVVLPVSTFEVCHEHDVGKPVRRKE